MMQTGGNRQLKEFYAKYDINDVEVPKKYSTNAAAHWRERLKTLAECGNFNEPAPDYQTGSD